MRKRLACILVQKPLVFDGRKDNVITFNIVNSGDTAETVTLFGSMRDLTDSALHENLKIQCCESSHSVIKAGLLTGESFKICDMKICVSSVSQFTNTWSISRQNQTGHLQRRFFQPINYRHVLNNLATQIDCEKVNIKIDYETFIQFSVNPRESVTLILRVKYDRKWLKSIKKFLNKNKK